MYYRMHVRQDKSVTMTIDENELSDMQKTVLWEHFVRKDGNILVFVFYSFDQYSEKMLLILPE